MTFEDPGLGAPSEWEAAGFSLAKVSDPRASIAVATTGLADLARNLGQAAGSNVTLGPGMPIGPQHQTEAAAPDGGPRRWDYAPGYNVQQRPRAYEGISFETLRAVARNYDVAYLAREKRKDGIRSLDWDIVPVPMKGLDRKGAKARADRLQGEIDDVTGWLQKPNLEDQWGSWLAQWLDDLWILDAATIYIRKDRAGRISALDVPDGSTFRPIIDLYGRAPLPPMPAYGQVIRGMTWSVFTTDQLVYQPYWQTTDSPYGSPPIEWVLLAANRALRRQTQDLADYTDGNLPAAFLRVPGEMQGQDLKDLREMLDAMMSGNDAARSKVVPVPGGVGSGLDRIVPEPKNEVEEWLMHITCAAHGVDPEEIGFKSKGGAKLGGTGQAQRSADVAIRREKSLVNHITRILSGIIQLDHPELVLAFRGMDDPEDQLQVAQATDIYIRNGSLAVDEVREDVLDKDPIGLAAYVMTTNGPILVEDILKPPEPVAPPAMVGQPATEGAGGTGADSAGDGSARNIAKATGSHDMRAWGRRADRLLKVGATAGPLPRRSPAGRFDASSPGHSSPPAGTSSAGSGRSRYP